MAGMVLERSCLKQDCFLTHSRSAEQSDGGKTVGVDPTVITARWCYSCLLHSVTRLIIDS